MDALDARIRQVLVGHGLPRGACADYPVWAAERLREDVEIAIDVAALPPERRWKKREVSEVAAAAEKLGRKAAASGLASADELAAVARIQRRARVAATLPSPPGPALRPWLWPCCLNFLDAWRALGGHPDGVWSRSEDSPALAFLVACCRLVDPAVTASAILRARAASPEKAPPATSRERQAQEAARAAAYEAWSDAPAATLLSRRD